jgi:hypothetical protein
MQGNPLCNHTTLQTQRNHTELRFDTDGIKITKIT